MDTNIQQLARRVRQGSTTRDRTIRRDALVGQIPAAVLIVLCAVVGVANGNFLTEANLTNVLVQGSVMTVVALGMTFVILAGGFDLSVGSVVALSGCLSTYVMSSTGFVVGMAAGVAVGALVGLINGVVVAHLKVNPFITTLGTMTLVRGLVLLMTDGAPMPADGVLPAAFAAFGVERLFGIHYIVWTPILMFVALAWLLARTPYGRSIYATGGNREAAFLSGIAVSRVIASTYVWCGALAGLAGVMLASRLQSGQPTAGEFYELTAIAAVVLGGAALHGGEGRLYKSVIGVFIMVVLSNGLNLMNVGSYWQRVAVGLVIVAAAATDQLRRKR